MRIVSFAVVLVCCAGIAGALAACGGGSAPPASSSLPTIADPLDLSKDNVRPCLLASANDLAQYHLSPPGTLVSAAEGPACSWTPTVAAMPSYEGGVDMRSGGLAGLYGRRKSMAVFQPTSVSEYPAVQTATTAAALKRGQCTVDVAVANDTLLDVSVDVPTGDTLDYSAPCDNADTFAATLIANAEAASP